MSENLEIGMDTLPLSENVWYTNHNDLIIRSQNIFCLQNSLNPKKGSLLRILPAQHFQRNPPCVPWRDDTSKGFISDRFCSKTSLPEIELCLVETKLNTTSG